MLQAAPRLETCPDRLSDAQLDRYRRDGFLAFEGALSPAEVVGAREALSSIVNRSLSERGLWDFRAPASCAPGNHSGASFHLRGSRCFFQLEPGQSPADDPDALERQVRKFMGFETEADLFTRLCASHPKTFGLVEQILGGDAVLYQSMALIKPAHHGSEKPWHQDNAYFSVENMDGVIGTWIALDDVDAANGCMHVLPGGHRAGPLRHHHTFDCEIVPGRIDPAGAVPVPMRAGGILLFHSNLPHQTPRNHSAYRRRALQFHYRRTDNAVIAHDAYDRIFVESDGTPASCDAARRNGF